MMDIVIITKQDIGMVGMKLLFPDGNIQHFENDKDVEILR